MELKVSYLEKNPCYKAGKRMKVQGLMLHSVGCPQPSAESFIRKWNSPDYGRACVHGFIDADTGMVYQTLPWDYRAWHCGGSGNNTHIGVEMCEPACIKYTAGASFQCSDREKAVETVERTYKAAVELFAYLCSRFGLDPLRAGVIVSHKEGHDRGIASGHGDPEHIWNQLNTGYTMDGFRAAVRERMGSVMSGAAGGDAGQDGAGRGAAVSAGGAADSPTAGNGAAGNPTADNPSAAGGRAIQPGDIVTIKEGAPYYSGKEIPSWVKQDRWIVKSVSGDRVVIDKNESGTQSICSPVNVNGLILAGANINGAAGVEAAEKSAVPASDITGQEKTAASGLPNGAAPGGPVGNGAKPAAGAMSISDRGVDLIARFEGCRLTAYRCPAGVWTIGYGHTAGVREGQTITQEQARQMLKQDAQKFANQVNACAANGAITFPLNQNQFDALTSFTYNCGAGSLKKLVAGRTASQVADTLPAYNKGGGKVLAGLTKRREEERRLFLENV